MPRRSAFRSPRLTQSSPGFWSRAPQALLTDSTRSPRSIEAGIPVGVNVAPIIPGINEHEIPSITAAAAKAGAQFASYTIDSAAADGRTDFCRMARDPFSRTEREGFRSNPLDAKREIEQRGVSAHGCAATGRWLKRSVKCFKSAAVG